MTKETYAAAPEPLFPEPYSTVTAEHPLILTALDELREKREVRAVERSNGRYSDEYRDSAVGSFIGMGDEKVTLGVDGLAVKILHENPGTHYSFDDQVAPLRRGQGVDGLEQLVTGNPEESVIITELMPGRSIASIPALELARLVKSEHIAKLETTLSQMRKRELDFDNVGNILFDPAEGFSIIDYRFITHDGSPIGTESDPSITNQNRKRQEEMTVETVLSLAATTHRHTSKVMMDGYGEFASSHVSRPLLGKLAVKTAFSRFR